MILGSDKNPAVFVPDRLVCPPVTELKFVGISAKRKCGDLVTHADPENGEISEEIVYAPDRIRGLLGVAGPLLTKRASGLQAIIWSDVTLYGKIYRSPFRFKRLVSMFFLIPRSITAIRFPVPGI